MYGHKKNNTENKQKSEFLRTSSNIILWIDQTNQSETLLLKAQMTYDWLINWRFNANVCLNDLQSILHKLSERE